MMLINLNMLLSLTMAIIVFFIFLLTYRIIRSKSLYELLIYLNLVNVKLALLLIIYAVMRQSSAILDIALTYCMIGFLSMTLLTKLLLKGGRIK